MKSIIDNDVNLGGNQTITGEKIFSNTIKRHYQTDIDNRNAEVITIKNLDANIRVDQVPLYSSTCLITLRGSDGAAYGFVGGTLTSNERSIIKLESRSISIDLQNDYHSSLEVVATKNGSTYATAPATTVTNGIVTQTIVGSKSLQLGNGFMFQSGTESGVVQGATITFPQPFSATPDVTLTQISAVDTAYHVYLCSVSSTSFVVKRHSDAPGNFSWLAMGK